MADNDRIEIVGGPSRMGLLLSYFGEKEVTFVVEARKAEKTEALQLFGRIAGMVLEDGSGESHVLTVWARSISLSLIEVLQSRGVPCDNKYLLLPHGLQAGLHQPGRQHVA